MALFLLSFSVLYYSWHRYEHQKFWPLLRESDYDAVGQGEGKGFNINVPWNKVNVARQHNCANPIALSVMCSGQCLSNLSSNTFYEKCIELITWQRSHIPVNGMSAEKI